MPIFFASLVQWIAASFALDLKRDATKIAATALFISFLAVTTIAFFVGIFTFLSGVSTAIPSTASMVWGWVMPNNATSCMSLILVARVLRAGLDYKIQVANKIKQSVGNR